MRQLAHTVLLSIIASLLVCNAHAQAIAPLFTYQPAVMPEFSHNGQHKVGVKTIEVTNPSSLDLSDFSSIKDRKLTLEVWYPAASTTQPKASYEAVTRLHKPFEMAGEAHRNEKPALTGRFPLVVLSHGYTGYRTIMYYLGEHLASHGYIVIGIDHTDSTTAEIDMLKAPTAGFVSTLINRARDQQFVLASASSSEFFLKNIIDTNKSSVIGYSMGGYGALNTVGGCYDAKPENLMRIGFPEQAAKNLLPLFNFCNAGRKTPDERWKAMIAFAPWGQEHNLHQASALANIQVPTLYVSGDEDDISGYEQGVKRLYEQTNKQDNYLLVYENARHNIAPHPAPKVAFGDDDIGHFYEPAWNSEQLTRINEHMSLVFLDCYVKKQEQRCSYLPKKTSATQKKQANGKLEAAWPGFKERWATGIQFHRAQ